MHTVEPVARLPELNLPSLVGLVPLVTVCVEGPLFVHLTIPFTLTVTGVGVNEKSWIVTFVVPDAGHVTSCALRAAVPVKLTAVMFAPLTVCGLLAGLKVKPALLGVTV